MDRASPRYGYLALALAMVGLLPAAGCSALAAGLWAFGYNNVPPEYDGLQQKKVAVVCRPVTSLHYQDSHAARDIAVEIGKLLEANGKKIKVIDPRKVERWCDENTWDEYVEVGKAVGADVVLGIDLEHFDIYEGQTLYQGKANTTLRIQDCKTGKVLFEKTPPRSVYPPNACISTSEKQPAQFRREFIKVLADRLARHFYPHDPYGDMAQDAAAL